MQSPQTLSQKVVIIGAGIVGANVADELISLGWTDITVVEQGPLSLPGGSTSHAPGLVFQTNSSKTMTELAQYTVQKLLSLEKDGENCFDQTGGLEIATSPERFEDLKRKHGWALSWGINAHLVTPADCIKLYPLLNQQIVLGGLHIPSDGLAKAALAVQLLIDRTSRAGVRYIGSTPVIGIEKSEEQVHGVITTQGVFPADVVICCAGFWGVEIGKMVDLSMPLLPLAHQYVKTSVVPALVRRRNASTAAKMPILRHQDEDLYYREHGDHYGIGYYGHRPLPVNASSLGLTPMFVDEYNQPSRLGFTPEDFKPAWEESRRLIPTLESSDVADGFNGIFSFTPDGAPLIGQAPGLDGFYVAEAVWVTHSAGVARAIAQLLSTGHSTIDLTECQLSRFETVQLTPEYISETSQQNFVEVYDIIHPWQPRLSPRALRVSPFYARQRELRACFVDTKAWERPEYYETNLRLVNNMPSRWRAVNRDAWSGRFYSVAAAVEAWKVRTAAAMFDLTHTTRLTVSGPGAVKFLQRLCSRDMSTRSGTIKYALFLNENGFIRGDAKITKLNSNLFHLSVASNIDTEYLTREARYQSINSPRGWVQVTDISSGTCSIGLWGPKAYLVMKSAGSEDFKMEVLPYGHCRYSTITGIPVLLMRISDLGEDGWEIHTNADQGKRLWDALWQAGQTAGLVAAGHISYVALRLEMGFRAFGIDFTSEHDPVEAGVEFAVDPEKRGYVGHDALQQRKGQAAACTLRWLTIDDVSSVVMGKEPVFNRGKAIGYITTGAFGFAVGKSIAHARLRCPLAEGEAVTIKYFGRMIPATVSKAGTDHINRSFPSTRL